MNDVHLEPTDAGILLPIRAQPRARRNGLDGVHDGALRVRVTAPPEDGRANEAIERVLVESLGLRRSQVMLHAGATSRRKTFLVTGCSPDELRERIEAALAD